MTFTLFIGLVLLNLPSSVNAQNNALSQDDGDGAAEQKTKQEQSSNQDNQVVSGGSTIASGNNLLCDTMDKSNALEGIVNLCSDIGIDGLGERLDPITITINFTQYNFPQCYDNDYDLCNDSSGGFFLIIPHIRYGDDFYYRDYIKTFEYKNIFKDPSSGRIKTNLWLDYNEEFKNYRTKVTITGGNETGNNMSCVNGIGGDGLKRYQCDGYLRNDATINIEFRNIRHY